jgi:hypothetical protein
MYLLLEYIARVGHSLNGHCTSLEFKEREVGHSLNGHCTSLEFKEREHICSWLASYSNKSNNWKCNDNLRVRWKATTFILALVMPSMCAAECVFSLVCLVQNLFNNDDQSSLAYSEMLSSFTVSLAHQPCYFYNLKH